MRAAEVEQPVDLELDAPSRVRPPGAVRAHVLDEQVVRERAVGRFDSVADAIEYATPGSSVAGVHPVDEPLVGVEVAPVVLDQRRRSAGP